MFVFPTSTAVGPDQESQGILCRLCTNTTAALLAKSHTDKHSTPLWDFAKFLGSQSAGPFGTRHYRCPTQSEEEADYPLREVEFNGKEAWGGNSGRPATLSHITTVLNEFLSIAYKPNRRFSTSEVHKCLHCSSFWIGKTTRLPLYSRNGRTKPWYTNY